MIRKDIPAYFKARRNELMKKHPGSVFILWSGPEMYRNPDVDYPYRQESNFYYLTGFEEPESFLVLSPKAGSGTSGSNAAYTSTMFVRTRDVTAELWTGERYGVERVPALFGVDAAYPVSEFDTKVLELLKHADSVYTRIGPMQNWDVRFDQRILSVLETARRSYGRSGRGLLPIYDVNGPLGEMRLFKQPEEIELLRKACQITAQGHKTLMKEARPGMNEYEMEALIDYSFKKKGCKRNGYFSIVAGGKNATCLHYRENNEVMNDGDLLLVDAGGEYEYYTADITRTFPIGKRFSETQAKVYDLVLKAQEETLLLCKPGTPYANLHQRASEVLAEGLVSMGLLKGSPKELVMSAAIKRFYPHGTGHYLGMDVHDLGLYQVNGEARKLQPGMCFTVEPGLYFQPGDTVGVPEAFRGIGIRIEDNVVITAQGYENLTKDAPKERAEIEALR